MGKHDGSLRPGVSVNSSAAKAPCHEWQPVLAIAVLRALCGSSVVSLLQSAHTSLHTGTSSLEAKEACLERSSSCCCLQGA
jgi:hypothetical protein